MAIKPICPFCGLAASLGGTFLQDRMKPRMQSGRVESDLHFTCGSCDTRFPAYAYTPNVPSSFVSNVFEDAPGEELPAAVPVPTVRRGFFASYAQAA